MIESWQTGLLATIRTLSQILTAGIAITAFSLLLYALTFNLRERVARSFALILICIVIVFTAESIGSTRTQLWEVEFWLRIQWVGIILLPPTYFQFSDALLATTGKISKGRRRFATRLIYLVAFLFLAILPTPWFLGAVVVDAQPAPHLKPTSLTDLFILNYLVIMVLAWFNFWRANRRTTTSTSRRRMAYLITSAIAPVLGSFPFLLYGSGLAARHPLIFWLVVVVTNFLVGGFVVVMAYAVAFFGVPWPDRVVKSRLFKWLMRGPVTASLTLGLVTVVRRVGEVFGVSYTALVPITMVGTVLLCEYLITLFAPLGEKWLFYGNDRDEIATVHDLENRLLTQNDLRQFLEMVLSALCDRLQAPGAYVVALNEEGMELVVRMGKTRFDQEENPDTHELLENVQQNGNLHELFQWGDDLLVPLLNGKNGGSSLVGLLGVSAVQVHGLDEEQMQDLYTLGDRARMALHDHRAQQQVIALMESLTPEVEYIQRLRAVGRFNDKGLLEGELVPATSPDLVGWVKNALTHYWGGPKLTESPLMRFKVVQEAIESHDGNPANALRAILKTAIEKVRPEGERRYTGEWILYNILEMKFLEGKKVREIAMRLAMSEADLYRKQRIAIEEVAKAILDLENQAQLEIPNDPPK